MSSFSNLWEKAFYSATDEFASRALLQGYLSGQMDIELIEINDAGLRRKICDWFIELLCSMSFVDLLGLIVCVPYPDQEVPQFGSFTAVMEAATVLSRSGSVMTYRDLGGALNRGEGKERNVVAKVKYGENQGKLAVIMGLAKRAGSRAGFKSTQLGVSSFLLKDSVKRIKLAHRLLLRSVHFRDLLCINIPERRNSLEAAYSELSESTRQRRIRSLRTMYRELTNEFTPCDSVDAEIRKWLKM